MRCPIYQARLVKQGVAWQRQEIDQFVLCGYLIIRRAASSKRPPLKRASPNSS